MKNRPPISAVLAIIFILIVTIPAVVVSEERHSHKDTNPLVEEMLILDKVFRDVVSAVSLGNGEAAHQALKAMHGTMEKTHEGVEKGTVQIPRNADHLEEFVAMDTAFHDDLERLAHASHENDQKKMLELTKKLLDGCVACHQKFR